jgi:hypothetical protein
MCSIWDQFLTAPCENQIQQNDVRGVALTGRPGEYRARRSDRPSARSLIDNLLRGFQIAMLTYLWVRAASISYVGLNGVSSSGVNPPFDSTRMVIPTPEARL